MLRPCSVSRVHAHRCCMHKGYKFLVFRTIDPYSKSLFFSRASGERVYRTWCAARWDRRSDLSTYSDFSNAPPVERVSLKVRRASVPDDAVFLPRSVIMDKEVITRTSGKRLGYVNQLYLDPVRLRVVSVYMRPNASSIAATNTDHVLISSLRQIGDVILVHDESSLMDPPADEMYGYISLVGAVVATEDGTKLGKIRDFVFNPDTGDIISIQYDALGIPSIPQSLLSCYSLDWREIIAVGPNEAMVRRGAQKRARKENDGWISEYVSALVSVVTGVEEENFDVGSEAYRSDPAYLEWYAQHAKEYEKYYKQRLPKPIPVRDERSADILSRREVQQKRERPRQPAALPPPRSRTYGQALQPETNSRRGLETVETIRQGPSSRSYASRRVRQNEFQPKPTAREPVRRETSQRSSTPEVQASRQKLDSQRRAENEGMVDKIPEDEKQRPATVDKNTKFSRLDPSSDSARSSSAKRIRGGSQR